MLKKFMISSFAGTVIAVSGSLVHPFGVMEETGKAQAVLSQAQIDAGTLGLLEQACQNCHSERTHWPWYSHIAPISWLIARDVHEAHLHLNLSRWQDYSAADQVRLLAAIGSAARNRVMPPSRYTLMHSEARLTDQARQQIYQWTRAERKRLRMHSIRTAP